MLRFINDDYRILSFDPGSRKLGMCVQSLDVPSMDTCVIHAETLNVDSRASFKTDDVLRHGELSARLSVLRDYAYNACTTWCPSAVVIELPYMGKRPQAYGVLREVVLTLRQACLEWAPNRPPFLYEPSVIKKAMGVPGNSGDKNLMTKALQNHPSIQLASNVVLSSLDEHAIDAILIGRTHVHIGIQKKDIKYGKAKKVSKRKQKASARK